MKISVISIRGGTGAGGLAAEFDDGGGSIGRASTNLLVLDDPDRTVSRVHAQVLCRNGAFFIVDRGSNPLSHNGLSLGWGKEAQLSDGDRLHIGSFELAVSNAKNAAGNSALLDDLPTGAIARRPAAHEIADDPFADLLEGLAPTPVAKAAIEPAKPSFFPDPMGMDTAPMRPGKPDPFGDLMGFEDVGGAGVPGQGGDVFAGLPNASYLAFTGTPLLGRDRKTNEWFGDYVSEYTFAQSMEDGATVPLFYQKRVPEMLIQNEDLSEEFYQIIEEENLDEAGQEKLEKRFATEMQVITRDDRLETIAKDIVYHFPRRGYLGKGMVVTVDKFTAVKMHDKVQRLWKDDIKALLGRITLTPNEVEKRRLKNTVEWMRKVEMAVVISEEAGEVEKFAARGLNIAPHRVRMHQLDAHMADIEGNFKDEAHPLQLVFVCAMWLTGFDAPSLSTLYLDKPMKDHTLMQTIARANRVTPFKINRVDKTNGEIVDYYNVFRNMKKALKDYAQGADSLDEPPVRDKAQLHTLLDDAIQQALAHCDASGIGLRTVLEKGEVFEKLGVFNQLADTLLASDEVRRTFYVYESTVSSLYEACKPEVLGLGKTRTVAALAYLRGIAQALVEQQDIDKVAARVSALLDESIVVNSNEGHKVKDFEAEYAVIKRGRTWDLSKIDFDKLRQDFGKAIYKNIEIADLRGFIARKLELMLAQNSTRGQFAQRFQQIIENYNAGNSSTEQYFEQLMQFTEDMRGEDERHVREGLTEDELEIFDLLKKDALTQAEIQKVKLAAKALLRRLQSETPRVLVQDWYKTDQTRRVVRSAVAEVLHKELPEASYDRALFQVKCDNVFHLVLDHAAQGKKWVA